MPRMTYFLLPGPRSWIDRPGMAPAISMIPEALLRCSASPEMAWMDTGVSNTLVAFNLLAVTTTSPSSGLSDAGADPAGASAATATPADSRPATVIAMIREPLLFGTIFLTPQIVWRVERLVVVVDTRVVPGANDPDDIDTIRRCCFQRMELLARQKDHVPRRDP